MNVPVALYTPAQRERFRKRLLLFYSAHDAEGSGRITSALTLRVPEATIMSSLYSKYKVSPESEETAARAKGLLPETDIDHARKRASTVSTTGSHSSAQAFLEQMQSGVFNPAAMAAAAAADPAAFGAFSQSFGSFGTPQPSFGQFPAAPLSGIGSGSPSFVAAANNNDGSSPSSQVGAAAVSPASSISPQLPQQQQVVPAQQPVKATPVVNLPEYEKARVRRRVEKFYDKFFPEGAWKVEEAMYSSLPESDLIESLCVSYKVAPAKEIENANDSLPSSLLQQQVEQGNAKRLQQEEQRVKDEAAAARAAAAAAKEEADNLRKYYEQQMKKMEQKHKDHLETERLERQRLMAEKEQIQRQKEEEQQQAYLKQTQLEQQFEEAEKQRQLQLQQQKQKQPTPASSKPPTPQQQQRQAALSSSSHPPTPPMQPHELPRPAVVAYADEDEDDVPPPVATENNSSNSNNDAQHYVSPLQQLHRQQQLQQQLQQMRPRPDAPESAHIQFLKTELAAARSYTEALNAVHKAEMEEKEAALLQQLRHKAEAERQLASESQLEPSRRDLLYGTDGRPSLENNHANGGDGDASPNRDLNNNSVSSVRRASPRSEQRFRERMSTASPLRSTPSSPVRVRGHASPEHPLLMVCGVCGEQGRERFCHNCGAAYEGHDLY